MRLVRTIPLAALLLCLALPARAQDGVISNYYTGTLSFVYEQWPFGSYDGVHSAAGDMLDADMGWLPGQTESVGGRLETRSDTLTAWCYGAVLNPDETVDMGGVLIRTGGEELLPGDYEIDLTDYMVMFLFLDDIQNFYIPEEGADMVDYLSGLVADQKFYGTGGTISVSEVDEFGFSGSFSGFMADPGDFKIIEISDGLFDTDGLPVGVPASTPRVTLHGAYPNPFNPRTSIQLQLSGAERLRVSVHDVTGRELRVLAEGRREAGELRLEWNGRDARGARLPAGVYLYRIRYGATLSGGKMVLIP